MQLPENSRPSDQDAAELRHNEVLGSSLPNRENVAGKKLCPERHTPSRFIADSSPCANKAGMRGE
jgi:hypothetical protein